MVSSWRVSIPLLCSSHPSRSGGDWRSKALPSLTDRADEWQRCRQSAPDREKRPWFHALSRAAGALERVTRPTTLHHERYCGPACHGIAGTLPLGERPEGRRLLQDAEASRFGCVLVYRLTRLGRSLKALTEAHEILSRCGVTIRSATEPFGPQYGLLFARRAPHDVQEARDAFLERRR